MRFLADENFPGDVVVALRRQGHDVVWILQAMRILKHAGIEG